MLSRFAIKVTHVMTTMLHLLHREEEDEGLDMEHSKK